MKGRSNLPSKSDGYGTTKGKTDYAASEDMKTSISRRLTDSTRAPFSSSDKQDSTYRSTGHASKPMQAKKTGTDHWFCTNIHICPISFISKVLPQSCNVSGTWSLIRIQKRWDECHWFNFRALHRSKPTLRESWLLQIPTFRTTLLRENMRILLIEYCMCNDFETINFNHQFAHSSKSLKLSTALKLGFPHISYHFRIVEYTIKLMCTSMAITGFMISYHQIHLRHLINYYRMLFIGITVKGNTDSF